MQGELTKQAIADLIKNPTPLVFEVGCYDGKDSAELNLALVKKWFRPTFFCFEADPRSQELFNQNHSKDTSLLLISKAVGSVDGKISFHKSDSDTRRHFEGQESWSASSSIKAPKNHLELFPDVHFKDQIEVECIRLDSFYIKNFRGQLVDFMWVDINGAEEDFIKGALGTLQHKTAYLYIEFSDKELYEGQIGKEEILKQLTNFEEVAVYNFQGNFGNVLLKNKTL